MKKLSVICIICCLMPINSFAGVMEEVIVVAVKLVVKHDWQTYYTVGYLDGGVMMDTAFGGGGGLESTHETAEDDSGEDERLINVTCGDSNSLGVASTVFKDKLLSKGNFGRLIFLADIRKNDSKWELEFPDGSVGTYNVGYVMGTYALDYESCSG